VLLLKKKFFFFQPKESDRKISTLGAKSEAERSIKPLYAPVIDLKSAVTDNICTTESTLINVNGNEISGINLEIRNGGNHNQI